MPKTTLDVVTAAARLAGVAAADVPLDAQDYAVCEPIYLSMMEALYEKDGFYDLSDPDAVPLWAFNPLREMLAVKIADTYERRPPSGVDYLSGWRTLNRYQREDDRGAAPPKETAFY